MNVVNAATRRQQEAAQPTVFHMVIGKCWLWQNTCFDRSGRKVIT